MAHIPMMALLLALSCRSAGILNTTAGRFKNKLCEMSRRSNNVRSTSSSGNLLIWLLDMFKSKKCRKRYEIRLVVVALTNSIRNSVVFFFAENLPVRRLNLAENFGGIFLMTFELRSQVLISLCLIKWYTASGICTNWHSERSGIDKNKYW